MSRFERKQRKKDDLTVVYTRRGMTGALCVSGGEAAARSKILPGISVFSLAAASPPMIKMNHVIPHPGFLRDAGSPSTVSS